MNIYTIGLLASIAWCASATVECMNSETTGYGDQRIVQRKRNGSVITKKHRTSWAPPQRYVTNAKRFYMLHPTFYSWATKQFENQINTPKNSVEILLRAVETCHERTAVLSLIKETFTCIESCMKGSEKKIVNEIFSAVKSGKSFDEVMHIFESGVAQIHKEKESQRCENAKLLGRQESTDESRQHLCKCTVLLNAWREKKESIAQILTDCCADAHNDPIAVFEQELADGKGSATLRKAIEQLVMNGHDIDARDDQGRTALLHACRNGDKVLADILLQCGANPKIADKMRNTPLHYVARCGEEIFDMRRTKEDLLQFESFGSGGFFYHNGERIFRCMSNDQFTLPLSKNLLDVDQYSEAFAGDKWAALANILIFSGADVNAHDANGYTPLVYAIRAFNYRLIGYMVDRGNADVNCGDSTQCSLYHAVMNQDTRTVGYLIFNGADKHRMIRGENGKLYSLMDVAIGNKYVEMQKFLQSHGVQPVAQCPFNASHNNSSEEEIKEKIQDLWSLPL